VLVVLLTLTSLNHLRAAPLVLVLGRVRSFSRAIKTHFQIERSTRSVVSVVFGAVLETPKQLTSYRETLQSAV
jgi:hypothetical protein